MSNCYKIIIIDTYYPKYLSSLYSKFPHLRNLNYAEQKNLIIGQCFGTADFYSKNLKALGCEAEDIIANNEIIQRQWAVENGLKLNGSLLRGIKNKLPFSRKVSPDQDVFLTILEAQIKKAKPDVLYLQDLSYCPPNFLQRIRRYSRLIVGQIACPLPPHDYLKNFDLILTSFPHYVERFLKMGIKSEYFKISFEPAILEKIEAPDRNYLCTFVGGISLAHNEGTVLLEELARKVEIDFFGYGAETLDKDSPILAKHHGEVWGLDMYKALMSSQITLNRHIDVAENYANNMRLYEATGCGAMLITDHKDNLDELFKVGKEVEAYRTVDELVELIRYYSVHHNERERIAKAGQERTLSDYTYCNRMGELIDIIGNNL
jgi:spore maturation protein CgeB